MSTAQLAHPRMRRMPTSGVGFAASLAFVSACSSFPEPGASTDAPADDNYEAALADDNYEAARDLGYDEGMALWRESVSLDGYARSAALELDEQEAVLAMLEGEGFDPSEKRRWRAPRASNSRCSTGAGGTQACVQAGGQRIRREGRLSTGIRPSPNTGRRRTGTCRSASARLLRRRLGHAWART